MVSNQDNHQDHYMERVDIYHYNRAYNLFHTTYGENDFIKEDLVDEINYLANNLQNLELISVNDMNSSKIFGKDLIYTYYSNLGLTKSKEIMIKNNTDLFKIIFTSQTDEFDKFLPSINKIIDSFQIGKTKLV